MTSSTTGIFETVPLCYVIGKIQPYLEWEWEQQPDSKSLERDWEGIHRSAAAIKQVSWLVRDFKFNSEREGRERQRKAGKQATVAAQQKQLDIQIHPQGALDTSVPGILRFYSSRAKHKNIWYKLVVVEIISQKAVNLLVWENDDFSLHCESRGAFLGK